jgi:hypothetical protein
MLVRALLFLYESRYFMNYLDSSQVTKQRYKMQETPTYSGNNPGPKDPALTCPLRELQWSFPLAAVYWSD